ncbi:MAG: hypothetical protein GY842_17830, partial [bacterium]|nr:hypothetical protein [bacterium]
SAQSVTNTALIASAEHTVTTVAHQGMEADVAPDPLITVPWGPKDPDAIPGETNTGQLQLPGAAYTLDVTNTSTVSHTFAISITPSFPIDWLILSGDEGQTETTLALPAGGLGHVGLYVSPTVTLLPPVGTEYPFSVTIVAVDAPALRIDDTGVFTVPAIPFNYVTTAPPIIYAAPNSTATFDIGLTNVGNVSGDFPVTVTLPVTTWTLSGLQSPVSGLLVAETLTQTVTFTATGAALGDEELIRVDSPAPGTAYTQTAYAYARIVGPCVAGTSRAAQTAALLPSSTGGGGLSLALQNLALQLEFWEIDPGDGTLRDRATTALDDIIARVQADYPLVDTADLEALASSPASTVADFCGPLADLEGYLLRIARRNVAVAIRPGAAAALPGQPATYTLSLENKGTLTTTYETNLQICQSVSQQICEPAHPPTASLQSPFTVTIAAGQELTVSVAITLPTLGYRAITAQTQASEDNLIQAQAAANLNVVDAFVRVLAVNADPAFVETGISSSTLSAQVANVANIYRTATARTRILAAGGSQVWTNDTPLTLRLGPPADYPLGVVETSGWTPGVYTITVELLDEYDDLIPDGVGYGLLAVGQALEPSHAVSPSLVIPGTVTVTTIITTESSNDGGTQSSNLNSTPAIVKTQDRQAGQTIDQQTLNHTSTNHKPPGLAAPFFQVSTGTVRIEEDDPQITYNGAWSTASAARASAGQYINSSTVSDTAVLTFTGPWMGVGFLTTNSGGYAEVFVDGVSQGVVDTYSRGDDVSSVYYSGFSTGTHTISVTVLGIHNPLSDDDRVSVDYFDIWDGVAMAEGTFEQDDERVHLSSNWSLYATPAASGGDCIRGGLNAWFLFTGNSVITDNSVTFQAVAYSSGGVAKVFLDGAFLEYVDLYSSSTVTRSFSYGSLAPGPHVLRVQGYRNVATVDAFHVPADPLPTPTPSPTGVVRYEEDDPALRYNGLLYGQTAGSWDMYSAAMCSRGYYARSGTVSDTVSLTFSGPWVGVGFHIHNSGGYAEVFVDGVSQGVVDTYGRGDDVSSVHYSGFSTGTHTISVTVLGIYNPLSDDDMVRVDYFDAW